MAIDDRKKGLTSRKTMSIRLFIILLRFHFACMMITKPSQAAFTPRLIMLNAKHLEYNDSRFYELNCSASRQSIGNGAEFIIDGQTVEHISFKDNKCYNSKIQECTADHCQCVPSDNVYIHKFKNQHLNTERVIGCQMRFADNESGDIIKAVTYVTINETALGQHEYDVKILKHYKEKNNDKPENNSFAEAITKMMPVIFGLSLTTIACLIVVFWCLFRYCNTRIEKERPMDSLSIYSESQRPTDSWSNVPFEIDSNEEEDNVIIDTRIEKERPMYSKRIYCESQRPTDSWLNVPFELDSNEEEDNVIIDPYEAVDLYDDDTSIEQQRSIDSLNIYSESQRPTDPWLNIPLETNIRKEEDNVNTETVDPIFPFSFSDQSLDMLTNTSRDKHNRADYEHLDTGCPIHKPHLCIHYSHDDAAIHRRELENVVKKAVLEQLHYYFEFKHKRMSQPNIDLCKPRSKSSQF